MTKKIFIGLAVVVGVGAIISGVIYVSNKYLDKQTSKSADITIDCVGKISVNHQVVIKDDAVIPAVTNGKLCDTMTIVNKDDKEREMAFGQHGNHVAYDGITEENLVKDKSLTVTFNKTGEYIFHDHHQDEVKGSFVVVNE